MNCFGCNVLASLPGERPVPEPLLELGEHWTLNYAEIGSAARPKFILQVRTHRNDLDDISPAELAEMGVFLPAATVAVREAFGAERCYAMLMNEAAHLH